MLFTKTHTYRFPMGKEELKSRLSGKHVRIHNLDFEILEKEQKLSIIPHAEQEEAIKTLPITSVVFKEEGDNTEVTVTSKMRRLDYGGPLLIIIFCAFMIVASFIMLKVNQEPVLGYTLLGIGIFILSLFFIRLQMGYFDYVRKVQAYIKSKADPVVSGKMMSFA